MSKTSKRRQGVVFQSQGPCIVRLVRCIPVRSQALLPKRNESNVEQLLREWDSLKRGLEMPGGPAMGFQRCARMQVCTKMCQASTCSNRLSFVFASRARLSFTPPVTSQNLAPAVMLGEKASQGRRFETGAHHRLCNRFNMIQPDSI